MFDLSLTKLLVLAVIALVVFGPHELPKIASQAGSALRDLRRIAEGAKADLREGLGPEFQDFDFDDLNPRRFVQKHLLDDDGREQARPTSSTARRRGLTAAVTGASGGASGARPPCSTARTRRSTSRRPERPARRRRPSGPPARYRGLRLSIRPARPRPLLASDSATLPAHRGRARTGRRAPAACRCRRPRAAGRPAASGRAAAPRSR